MHGLTASNTADAPTFLAIYPELEKHLTGKTVVAHNESFDRSVMQANMLLYGLDYRDLALPDRWKCTKFKLLDPVWLIKLESANLLENPR